MASESAAARIASQLRVEILHGDLAPGSKLAQVGLAERFGVSRIPVRDALAILAGEGSYSRCPMPLRSSPACRSKNCRSCTTCAS